MQVLLRIRRLTGQRRTGSCRHDLARLQPDSEGVLRHNVDLSFSHIVVADQSAKLFQYDKPGLGLLSAECKIGDVHLL